MYLFPLISRLEGKWNNFFEFWTEKRNAVPDVWSSHLCYCCDFLVWRQISSNPVYENATLLSISVKKEISCTIPTLVAEVLHEQVVLNTVQCIIWNVQHVIFGCQVCYVSHRLIVFKIELSATVWATLKFLGFGKLNFLLCPSGTYGWEFTSITRATESAKDKRLACFMLEKSHFKIKTCICTYLKWSGKCLKAGPE